MLLPVLPVPLLPLLLIVKPLLALLLVSRLLLPILIFPLAPVSPGFPCSATCMLLIVGAILIAPLRIDRCPLRMMRPEPVGIVLMPPVRVVPLVLVVVFAKTGPAGLFQTRSAIRPGVP